MILKYLIYLLWPHNHHSFFGPDALTQVCGSLCSLELFLDHCEYGASKFSLLGISLPALNGLHFGAKDNVPTRIYQDLATWRSPQMTSLSLPRIPQMFVPLILANHGNVTGKTPIFYRTFLAQLRPDLNLRQFSLTDLHIGQCTNQLIFYICRHLKHLTKLAFTGDALSYSGIIGLLQIRDSLTSLEIKNPKNLTKYSLKLLSSHLKHIRVLKLLWDGKMLINNPWCFEYSLDREKQRIDNLFQEESPLENLTEIELSAFYQTIDDKCVQCLCTVHLSSSSLTRQHLQKIHLKHCYRVTDAGIQWLVGSCHSPNIQHLDLSNTALTGNCFLRLMPKLTYLSLECCSSLNGQGLQNIAMSCLQLEYLSLSLNKQLNDEDLVLAFKSGLSKLKTFRADYTGINGSCFKYFKSLDLQELSLHSCQKLKDDLASIFQARMVKLHTLDLSASNITGDFFEEPLILPNVKRLYLDFCPQICHLNIDRIEKLRQISLFGTQNLTNLDEIKKKIRKVVSSSGSESEVQLREYASERGLHLNNWLITKKHMVKGKPPMLSQVRLTSWE